MILGHSALVLMMPSDGEGPSMMLLVGGDGIAPIAAVHSDAAKLLVKAGMKHFTGEDFHNWRQQLVGTLPEKPKPAAKVDQPFPEKCRDCGFVHAKAKCPRCETKEAQRMERERAADPQDRWKTNQQILRCPQQLENQPQYQCDKDSGHTGEHRYAHNG